MGGIIIVALFAFCLTTHSQVSVIPRSLTPFQLQQLASIRGIIQQLGRIESGSTRSGATAQIADAVWETDNGFARELYLQSLDMIAPRDEDTEKEKKKKKATFRKVVSLIAKRDSAWAKTILDRAVMETAESAQANLDTAEDLVKTDPKLAADFANRSLQLEITDGLVSLLKNLRQSNPAEADRLFVNIINRYQQQQNQDASRFGLLGTYLFGSPYVDPRDTQNISYTRVGNVMFPNISTNLPNINGSLVRTYIGGAVTIVNRPTDNSEQRQLRYVLSHLLIPKARQFAPDYVGALSGAMAASALGEDVSAFQSADAFRNINNTQTGTIDEQIAEIEKNPDVYTRNQLFLNLAHRTWRANDFPGARKANAGIEDKDVNSAVNTLILFGETKNALKKREVTLEEAIPMVEKLPRSLEKSVLWLDICAKAEKSKRPDLASYSLEMALKTSAQLSNENVPYILAYISGELAGKDSLQSEVVLREAVKEFNKLERVQAPSLVRKVRIEPLSMPFQLSAEEVSLDFQSSFRKAASGREDECNQIVGDLKDDDLKAEAFVALAQSTMKKKDAAPVVPKDGGVVRVNEESIRESALKTVMPGYPGGAVKRKAAGVFVAEIQYSGEGDVIDVRVLEAPDTETGAAGADALKQWKFKPSRSEGKPVSIRGKITFYFTIANGKGEVKNPKQFE